MRTCERTDNEQDQVPHLEHSGALNLFCQFDSVRLTDRLQSGEEGFPLCRRRIRNQLFNGTHLVQEEEESGNESGSVISLSLCLSLSLRFPSYQ